MKTNKVMDIILGVIVTGLVVIVAILLVHSKTKNPDRVPVVIPVLQPDQISSQVSTTPTVPAVSDGGVAIDGMSKYTDTNLGYSFWYPSSWVVNEVSSGGNPDLSGGSVTKTLAVGPADSMSEGITVQDFVSTGKTITDSSGCGPSDSCPPSVHYYFNSMTHLWMMEDYPYDTTLQQGVRPADISVNTMGGLHIFGGNERFGNDVIIPLSASHFVVVSGTSAGGIEEKPFANTIVATNPAVATPVSAAQQVQTIQVEKIAYMNIYSSSSAPTVDWPTYTDSNTGITLQYPSVNGVSLQPSIQITPNASIDTNGCMPEQMENGTWAHDTVVTINHITFCGTETTGSGMNHYDHTYYYTFLRNATYYTLMYDVSTVNCSVYGDSTDPGYQTCENDTSSVSLLIPFIQESLSTLTL